MKTLKYYIAVLFLFQAINAVSQVASDSWSFMNQNSNRLEGKLTGTMFYMTAEYNNNFFHLKDWMDGEIVLEDGDTFQGVKIRYLLKGDELVVYNETQKNLFIADKSKIRSFTIFTQTGTKRFVKMNYDGIIPEIRFFEILYKGNWQLLAFHHIEKRKAALYTDRNGNLRDSYFVPEAHYYLYSAKQGFERIRNKRKSYYRIFPEHKREIRRLLRRNRINDFDERSVIQSVKLLDEAGILE